MPSVPPTLRRGTPPHPLSAIAPAGTKDWPPALFTSTSRPPHPAPPAPPSPAPPPRAPAPPPPPKPPRPPSPARPARRAGRGRRSRTRRAPRGTLVAPSLDLAVPRPVARPEDPRVVARPALPDPAAHAEAGLEPIVARPPGQAVVPQA